MAVLILYRIRILKLEFTLLNMTVFFTHYSMSVFVFLPPTCCLSARCPKGSSPTPFPSYFSLEFVLQDISNMQYNSCFSHISHPGGHTTQYSYVTLASLANPSPPSKAFQCKQRNKLRGAKRPLPLFSSFIHH